MLEYGATDCDGNLERRQMYETELKLPKALRDIILVLLNDCRWDMNSMKNIEAIGYRHNGKYKKDGKETKKGILTISFLLLVKCS